LALFSNIRRWTRTPEKNVKSGISVELQKNTIKHDGIALGQGEENTYICNVRPDASKKHTKRKH
jgi:hypothetical protein